MAKKLTTFELEPKKKSVKKAPKQKKTMKQRLPVILPFFLILIIVLAIAAFIYFNASKVNNTNIAVLEHDIPVSTAEIVNTGFAAVIPEGGNVPTRIDSAIVGDTISAFCEVGACNEVATSLTVAWTLPDGTQSGVETVAVTRDGYYYATMSAATEGVYEVSWTLAGQRSASAKLTVMAAESVEDAEGGNAETPEASISNFK